MVQSGYGTRRLFVEFSENAWLECVIHSECPTRRLSRVRGNFSAMDSCANPARAECLAGLPALPAIPSLQDGQIAGAIFPVVYGKHEEKILQTEIVQYDNPRLAACSLARYRRGNPGGFPGDKSESCRC